MYAQFWIKVLDGFQSNGITVHYLTLQNEPHFEPHDYAGMRMDAPQQGVLIAKLGQLLSSQTNRPKILTWYIPNPTHANTTSHYISSRLLTI